MAWLSNEFGEMYQVDDPVYNTYAEELAATQAATAGATSNYYDASANGGEGGQVYVYPNGKTVTTNNIGQPTSATLPTSQYEATAPDMFRPVAGSPTSTNIGGFQVGITTPTYVGQNGQMAYDQYGQPVSQAIQPELSAFDKAMRAGTIGLAVAPWAYGAATGFGGASSGGGYLTPELMGPTYGELGYTGLEAGQMGPTYGELGYTGLNGAEAVAVADAAAASQVPSWLSSLASPLTKLGTGALSSALRQGAT